MAPSSLTIDDFGPLPVRRPTSVAELCGLVKEAAGSGQGVYPVGGRTTLDVGLPPTKPGFAVDMTALAEVIDYPARDMTITVQAGISIAKLQETLAAEGQWLPVDVSQPERATLGGAVALNKSGPHRLGCGTLRDYVIGISFVTDEGNEVKAGGRVVKNVAGYDLMKLQVGAAGTLGVITQLTLKVKPKPEAAALVNFGCETADLPAVLDLLHASRSRPVIAHLATCATSYGRAPWWLCVVLEEKRTTVNWQLSTLLEALRTAPVNVYREFRSDDLDDLETVVQSLVEDSVGRRGGFESRFTFKANIRPSRAAEFCSAARLLRPDLDITAEALSGIVSGHSYSGFDLNGASAITERLGDLAAEGGGNLVIRRCPTEWKQSFPIWGRPRGDHELMRHVKQTLDPQDVFNPGRMFG